ncbi:MULTISPECIES: hypothetical protein [Actinoplanes]|uniref:hypothetical protein n=1 Tax=Actinoplanes TaxID=1865 RepID=UPI0005F2DB62|nr:MULTISPECIES: hypothetical protein [Actinoplanes]GLY05915.1 hypothetical protein Acsp01_62940 [Actinoplanes sp. NBRC 101535]
MASKAQKTQPAKGGQPAAPAHTVSELVSDRAAAPSPFGDDQTFPLPVDSLRYRATMAQGD